MARAARTARRRRARLTVAGVVMFAALTAPTAAASTTPEGAAALAACTHPQPGFLLDQRGYNCFQAPDPGVQLSPFGINDLGQITGEYIRPSSESGFVRDANGRITVFDVQGAMGTEAVKVNDSRQIVGTYSENTPIVNDPNAIVHAYLLDGNDVTILDKPYAAETGASGINDGGQVVGRYIDDTGPHGFLWVSGKSIPIDVPDATATVALDVNDNLRVVGQYIGNDGAIAGFVWEDGEITTFRAPDAPVTLPFGINDSGTIVGITANDRTLAGARGFVATTVNGPFKPVVFPGAPRTIATGINDSGHIVGSYENPAATPSGDPAVGDVLAKSIIPGVAGKPHG